MSPGLASVTRDGLDPVQELHQHDTSAAAAILVQLEHVSPDARRQGCSWLWRDDGNGWAFRSRRCSSKRASHWARNWARLGVGHAEVRGAQGGPMGPLGG